MKSPTTSFRMGLLNDKGSPILVSNEKGNFS